MNATQILEYLNGLSENEMTEKVLIPLYQKRFKGVFSDIEFSGKDKREDEGADITYYSISPDTKSKQYQGIQVKQGNIGTGAGANGIAAIRIQAAQALSKDIAHVVDKKKYRIQKFILLTTGIIQPKARVKIVEDLNHTPIEFIDGKLLCEWITESFLEEIVELSGFEEQEDIEDSEETPLDVVTEHLKKNCSEEIAAISAVLYALDTVQQQIFKGLMILENAKPVKLAAHLGKKAGYVDEDLRYLCDEDVIEVFESGYEIKELRYETSKVIREASEYIKKLGYSDEVSMEDVIGALL